MAILEWSEDYVVGVAEIDEQHKHLFDIVNRLHKAVSEGAEQSMLGEILNELIDYTLADIGTNGTENLFHKWLERLRRVTKRGLDNMGNVFRE